MANIFQAPLLVNFLYPLLLIFFISFAILEKTSILGKDKKQLNAFVALIIGLIFVAAVFPKIMVENLVLYLGVGLIIIFVGLMLWGFISNKGDFTVSDGSTIKIHKIFVFLIIGSLICVVLWASGLGNSFVSMLNSLFLVLFKSEGSSSFWTNFIAIAIIFLAVAFCAGLFPLKKKFNPWVILKK